MIFIRFWFPVVVYSGIIFYVSSMETVKTPLVVPYADKFCHIVEYMIFGVLLARAIWQVLKKKDVRQLVVLTTLGSMLYGLSDEFHQSFVAGREAEIFDVFADTLGGFLGGLIFIGFYNYSKKKKI